MQSGALSVCLFSQSRRRPASLLSRFARLKISAKFKKKPHKISPHLHFKPISISMQTLSYLWTTKIIHCLPPVWNDGKDCLKSCKRKSCKMQNSRNSVTLINIEHVLHLKATAALRIVGNFLHFFLKIFFCILFAKISLPKFGRKLISLLQLQSFGAKKWPQTIL